MCSEKKAREKITKRTKVNKGKEKRRRKKRRFSRNREEDKNRGEKQEYENGEGRKKVKKGRQKEVSEKEAKTLLFFKNKCSKKEGKHNLSEKWRDLRNKNKQIMRKENLLKKEEEVEKTIVSRHFVCEQKKKTRRQRRDNFKTKGTKNKKTQFFKNLPKKREERKTNKKRCIRKIISKKGK